MIRSGGCLCGQIRFEVEGLPSRVSVCHCRYCQLRTGSAFGVSVYFPTNKITVISGNLQDYSLETESGNTLKIERCSNCGTSLFWQIDTKPYLELKGTAGGTYDPPSFWYDVNREVFTRTKAEFCSINAPETHETHSFYSPSNNKDEPRLSGD